jgi:outer membrane protein OmpA-like peptidoglycan-associated protein
MRRQIIGENKTEPVAPARGKRSSKSVGAGPGLPLFLKTSQGKPLDTSVRAKAEHAFGRDFKDVRVHIDGGAAESAAELQARAFTKGRDIVFGAGAYDPDSLSGQKLIAHELSHVVQQSRGTTPEIGGTGDTFEQSANQAGHDVLDGKSVSQPTAGPAPAIQRDPLPGLKPPPMLARAMGSGTIDGFVTGSAILSSDQKSSADVLAASIVSLRESYPGCTVSVTGHTDAVGPESTNMTLGQDRADAVAAELAAQGVPREIILTDSAGETQLKVNSRSAEPRNRRAEIRFEPESGLSLIPDLKLVPPRPLEPATAQPAPQLPNLFPPKLPPSYDEPKPETPEEAGRRIFAPIPPDPRKPSPPLLAPLIDKVDSLTQAMGLPKWARDLVRDGAKAAVVKGATAAADAAMDQTSMTPEQKRAVHSIVEAAVKGQLP